LFPLDVNFVIGQSDYRKDWFFEQVPYNTRSNNVTGGGRGDGTTWAVIFNLTNAPHGKATLRLALCGIGTRSLNGVMNNRDIGTITDLTYNATINRDGIGGLWCERDLVFDASLMKAGTNTLELTIPVGTLTSGIIYDYLRLELDENAPPPK
jgi:rhamnogalacturonan endolyase